MTLAEHVELETHGCQVYFATLQKHGEPIEELWRCLFEQQQQWIDKRHTKASSEQKPGSPRTAGDERPDFVHKRKGLELRVNDKSTPEWAKARLSGPRQG